MASFDITYNKFIQPSEGYFANLKGDKGGITYGGIAYNLHPEWDGWKIVMPYIYSHGGADKIRNNTRIPAADPLVRKFFLDWWTRLKFDRINSQDIANIYFDWIVNSGQYTPTKKIQALIGVNPDGILDTDTIDTINSMKAATLNNAIIQARKDFYVSIGKGTNANFLQGWLTRLSKFPTLTAATGAGIVLALIIASLLIFRK